MVKLVSPKIYNIEEHHFNVEITSFCTVNNNVKILSNMFPYIPFFKSSIEWLMLITEHYRQSKQIFHCILELRGDVMPLACLALPGCQNLGRNLRRQFPREQNSRLLSWWQICHYPCSLTQTEACVPCPGRDDRNHCDQREWSKTNQFL